MGNREKLLDGALQCLFEKGYARTTARDIAAAAGVSLAAIGYHFGTTETLLNAALNRALEHWGEAMQTALDDDRDEGRDPAARFEAIWTRIIASIEANPALWTTQFEVVTQISRLPEIRMDWQDSQRDAQAGLAELFEDVDTEAEPEQARLIGGLYQALLTGVVVQHLVSPETAMDGRDLAEALTLIAGRLSARKEV